MYEYRSYRATLLEKSYRATLLEKIGKKLKLQWIFDVVVKWMSLIIKLSTIYITFTPSHQQIFIEV